MKVLVVSDNPTHPTLAGNRACIATYCELLERLGHEVHLLYSHRDWVMPAFDLEATRSFWGAKFHLHRQSPIDRASQILSHRIGFRVHGGYTLDSLCPFGFPGFVERLCRRHGFDAVIVNYWSMTAAVTRLRGIRKILYAHDRFSDKLARTGGNWLSTTESVEREAFERCDVVLAIQEEETEFFRSLTSKPVLASFTYFPEHPQVFTGKKDILYLGGPNQPNIQGLTWFVQNAWPGIHGQDPSIRLLVGGRICSKIGPLGNVPGVVLQGDVDSLESFYAQGDISVNPTSQGTGLKIKTFEAMAHGKALVCHPHSAEGIYAPRTAPISLATTPEEYEQTILGFFVDRDALRERCEESSKYIRRLNEHVAAQFGKALEG